MKGDLLPKGKEMKFGLNRNLIIFIAVLTVAIALFTYFSPQASQPEEITLDETIAMSQNSEIEKIDNIIRSRVRSHIASRIPIAGGSC